MAVGLAGMDAACFREVALAEDFAQLLHGSLECLLNLRSKGDDGLSEPLD